MERRESAKWPEALFDVEVGKGYPVRAYLLVIFMLFAV